MENKNFDFAIEYILDTEGGFVDHPDDSGGPTKFGLSQRFLKSLYRTKEISWEPTRDKIFSLDKKEAKSIYRRQYWDFYNLRLLENKKLITKLFDCLIMSDSRLVIKNFQSSTNSSLGQNKLKVDGILGKHTSSVANNCDADFIINNFIIFMGQYYQEIVVSNPSQHKFLKGWLNRLLKLPIIT
jgi:type VI secretion system secreted protein VgrG